MASTFSIVAQGSDNDKRECLTIDRHFIEGWRKTLMTRPAGMPPRLLSASSTMRRPTWPRTTITTSTANQRRDSFFTHA